MIRLLATLIMAISSTVWARSAYEFVAMVGENVNGLALNSPQGLAVNPRSEEFLVADGLNDRVVIFDTTGAAVFTFPLRNNHHNPFGIAVNSVDEIIISPMDYPELWRYDYNGGFLDVISLPADVLPGRLLVDKEDNLYVVDRAGRGIIVLDRVGRVVKKIEKPGAGGRPSGVCFDRKGNVILVSAEGTAVTAFRSDGQVAYSLGIHGRRLEDFSRPTSAVEDARGWLWVVDSFRHHIKRFDRAHEFKDVVGQRGVGMGEFFYPVDLKITPRGKLGVLEKGAGRLQIFRLSYDK